jgi:sporulation protein YlmC with PRC-barrel domain
VRLGSSPSRVAQAAGSGRNQNMYKGSKIIGANIRDRQHNKLGVIKDIVLDSDRGEVAYVVANFGSVAGTGRKYHAIPWKALQASDDGNYYLLQADAETARNSPSFDRGKWPDMTDQRWSAEVNRYWDRMVGEASSNGISPNSGANSATGATSGSSGARSDTRR